MLCKKCKSTIPDDSLFCPECGEKVMPALQKNTCCEQCGNEIPKDSTFCPFCGSKTDSLSIKEKTANKIKGVISGITSQTKNPLNKDSNAAQKIGETFKVLYRFPSNYIQSKIPILICDLELIESLVTHDLFARCSFTNLEYQTITALMASVKCESVWGDELEQTKDIQYLDLQANYGISFGKEKLIPIPNVNTRKIQLKINKVSFANGRILDINSGETIKVEGKSLKEYFEKQEIVDEYIRETNSKARFVPQDYGVCWLCSCGTVNGQWKETCDICHVDKSTIFLAANPKKLEHNSQLFLQEQKRIIEEENERRRIAEEKRQKEQAWILEENRRRQEKEEESRKQKKQQTKRILKVVGIVLAIIAFIYLSVYIVVCRVIPASQYSKAVEYENSTQYEKAIELYQKLGKYEDSEIRITQCQKSMTLDGIYKLISDNDFEEAIILIDQYEEDYGETENATKLKIGIGKAMQNQGKYDEAISLFDSLRAYDNTAKDLYYDSKYQLANQYFENGNVEKAREIYWQIINYEDSREKYQSITYEVAADLLKNADYSTAINEYKKIEDYKDSKEKLKESYYLYAETLFLKEEYQGAKESYALADDYQDSTEKKKEATYLYAEDLMSRNIYNDAMTEYNEIIEYKDSKDKYQQAKYEYAKILLIKKKYEDAVFYFTSLENYKDSKKLEKEARYGYGRALVDEKNYVKAVEQFEKVGNYQDSVSLKKDAMYKFVQSHKKRKDAITYKYLKELVKSSYKDSKDIYKNLYKWSVRCIAVNTNPNDGSTLAEHVSKNCNYLHFIFEISGGPPFEHIDLSHKIIWPDGSTRRANWYWEKVYDGSSFGCGWDSGPYTDPRYAKAGRLTIEVYNKSTGEKLGSGSVRLVN